MEVALAAWEPEVFRWRQISVAQAQETRSPRHRFCIQWKYMPEFQGQPQDSLHPAVATYAAVAAAPAIVAPSRTLRWELWLRDLFISLAIAAFIIIFIYQPVKVEGTSMMPSLADHERIFVNKFVYRLEPIERGDAIRAILLRVTSSASLEWRETASTSTAGRCT